MTSGGSCSSSSSNNNNNNTQVRTVDTRGDAHRLVQLRNPWGSKGGSARQLDWRGDWRAEMSTEIFAEIFAEMIADIGTRSRRDRGVISA